MDDSETRTVAARPTEPGKSDPHRAEPPGEELRRQKFIMMTQGSLPSLITRLAIPSVISVLIAALYNLVDTWFISHSQADSTNAVAAVGVVFSFQAISQAIGFFFGHGSGNFISRALGRRDQSQAMEMAATGAFSAFLLTGAISLLCQIFPEEVLRMLGSSDEIMGESLAYFRWISRSMPFFSTQLVLNNQLRLQGNAHRGMVGMAGGALLNTGLDALLIFPLGMGVTGAGLATAISQLLSCIVLLAMTHLGDGLPPLPRNFRPCLRNYREILAGGLPSLARQGLNAVAAIVLNRCALKYGPDAMAGISIVTKVIHTVVSITIGIGQGFQPVCGFNYGAGKFHRVREAFLFAGRLGTAVMCLGGLSLAFFADALVSTFGATMETAFVATTAIRSYALSLPVLAFVIMTEMIHQNTRQTVRATILSGMRQGLAFAPMIIVLERMAGLPGILLAQPAANFIALAVATPMAISLLKKFRLMEKEQVVAGPPPAPAPDRAPKA